MIRRARETEGPRTHAGGGLAPRGQLSPVLVGRREEVGLVEEALLAAAGAEGSLILILGDAGIGKSRLAKHAQKRAGELGGLVIAGACAQGSPSLPYLPFVEGINNQLIQMGTRSVRRRLGPLAMELTDLFPQLDPRYQRPPGEDPQRSKLRLYEALASLLRVLTEDYAFLLIVLEDLQWADASTLELLTFLNRRLATTPFLVLGTARPGMEQDDSPFKAFGEAADRDERARVLHLEPLEADEVGAMAAAALGVERVDPRLRERLYQLSEGSPLILEEILRDSVAAAQGGDIADHLAVPHSYAEGIHSRLQRLAPGQAEILRAASVLNPPFTAELLTRVTGESGGAIAAALHAGASSRLLEEVAPGRFRFPQHLTREAVYNGLADRSRKHLHLRAASALEGDIGSAAFEVARHLLASGAGPEAVPACLRAAEQAAARKGYEEARQLYLWALDHVHDRAERGRVLAKLGEVSQACADRESAIRHFEEAVSLLEVSGLRREAARCRLLLGTCEWQSAHPDRARAQFELAIATLEPGGASETLADAFARLASLHIFQLESARARDLAEQATRVAHEAGSPTQEAWAQCFLGIARVLEGDVEGGIAALDSSYHVASERGLDWIALNAAYNGIAARLDHLRAAECPEWLERLRGVPGSWLREAFAAEAEARMLIELGQVQAAVSAARHAIETAEQTGAKTVAGWARRRLALALAEAGELERAPAEMPDDTPAERQELLADRLVRLRLRLAAGDHEGAAELARRLIDEQEWMQRDAVLVAAAVEAFTAVDDSDSAERLLDAVLERGMNAQDPFIEQAMGRLALAQGYPGDAGAHIRQAVGEFELAGYRIEELRSRLLAAEWHAATGDMDAARAEARTVVVAATECGAMLLASHGRRFGATVPAPAEPAAEAAADESEGRLGLISRFPRALRDNELVLHFQPEIELSTGRLAAVEALVRWQRPGRPLLAPDRFVPLAEQSGLINEMTGWVLDTALAQASDWQSEGLRVPVAVNVSVHDLERPAFAGRVLTSLSAFRIDPDMLCLEVTETRAMQAPHAVIASMERLRTFGVRLAIDDFGTGQSSLSHLRHFPADEIKIDKSFCADLSGSSLAILRSVVAMAHELGLRVVAEGIEKPEVADVLRQLGCELGQGMLFSAPGPAAQIPAFHRGRQAVP